MNLFLPPRQAADVKLAKSLLTGHMFEVVIGDRGSDFKDWVIEVEDKGGKAVIPSRSNATTERRTDWINYKDRDLVGRFWWKVKQLRGAATRFEKKAQNFLAFVHLAFIIIFLRQPMWPKLPKLTSTEPRQITHRFRFKLASPRHTAKASSYRTP